MDIIGVINFKGGTAKTTTAVNLAIGLAQMGKRVLAVDLDPQGSMSLSLGYMELEELEITVADKLIAANKFAKYDPREGILTHKEGIDLLPANINLVNTEMNLISLDSREYALAMYLETLKDDYDVVVLDCAPAVSLVTTNALTCATELIIPLQAHFLAMKGMEQLMQNIARVRMRLNPNLKIAGILMTMINNQTKFSKEIIPLVYEQYGTAVHIFNTPIPFSTKVIETSASGGSIYKYDSNSKVSQAYKEFLVEFTDR